MRVSTSETVVTYDIKGLTLAEATAVLIALVHVSNNPRVFCADTVEGCATVLEELTECIN